MAPPLSRHNSVRPYAESAEWYRQRRDLALRRLAEVEAERDRLREECKAWREEADLLVSAIEAHADLGLAVLGYRTFRDGMMSRAH